MDPYSHSTPISKKLLILDTGKFEQWKFRIQQYLQHEYYALWEVIEFGDSYKAPLEETAKDKGLVGKVSSSTKKKGRTVAITAKDMQKRKNDDIVSHFEFMDVPIEQDDLNPKFLTSLAPEWLVYIIVWRNRDDLDTVSLDNVYNHLKVYEPEVQKRVGSNSQNMAFIYSSNNISTQPNRSQIKYEDICQINDDDIEEMDIKWNLALLSMRADRFWKKTGKKITIQGSDVAGLAKSNVECFNYHKMGHFARECRSPRSQDRGNRKSYKKDPKVEEPAPKAMIAIDGIRWDWSYMDEEDEASKNHALVADEE
uniref:Uncharacterized protein n=1 Tax=Tanacetum cinerariifolium TaxID=118510 RepID=A0A6L2L921_TANCI|nr:hypothetical protein [Tanacetum cinerariifolium]